MFVAKYSPAGDELWAKSGNGAGANRAMAIATDAQGAVYVTGQFSGDITFDQPHPNSIQNALFLIKYSTAGSEAWFRWAGGTSRSMGYGLASNGTDVYLAGDCGQSLTFLGGSGTNVINSGTTHAVFVAAFGGSGNYLWGSALGSPSAVSVRGISHWGGQLGIAGWFECTFASLSAQYGAGTFNSVGFKDTFVARYNTQGQLLWGRQVASRQDDVANGIHILPDGLEVVAGSFTGPLHVPIRNSLNAAGLTQVPASPNPGLNFCGDPNYGQYSQLAGIGGQDGYLLKGIDLEREPYDFHKRYTGACLRDVPPACIAPSGILTGQPCSPTLVGCLPYNIQATPYTNFHVNTMGYAFNVNWMNGNQGNPFSVTAPGTVTATITSMDGCYTTTATAQVDVLPQPPKPTMSDSFGINNNAVNTQPVFLCPGDAVLLSFQTEPGNTFLWSGPGLQPGQANQPVLTTTGPGAYQVNVTNAQGCSNTNFIMVLMHPQPPPPIDPFFNLVGDTIEACQNQSAGLSVWDALTGAIAPSSGYVYTWSISPTGAVGGGAAGNLSVPQSGWYTVQVIITPEDNPCSLLNDFYELSATVYIHINPVPQVQLAIQAPAVSCGGPVTIGFNTNADQLTFMFFVPLQQWGTDSIQVAGAGLYSITGSTINSFGCTATATQTVQISAVSTPEAVSNPPNAVICPGETVELTTGAPGTITWIGPGGVAGTGSTITVGQGGLYFAEVFFYPGCALVSNTVQVVDYATPFLSSTGGILCPGGSVTVTIVSTNVSSIVWEAPLSGSDTTQVITAPGTYTALVTGCGVTTAVSIEVTLSPFTLTISQPDPSPVCQGGTITLVATPGLSNYQWQYGPTEPQVEVTESGSYQLTATDPNGCALTSNVLPVAFEPIPPAPLFTSAPPCIGDPWAVGVQGGFTATWLGPSGEVLLVGLSANGDALLADTTFTVVLSSPWCTGPQGNFSLSPKPRPDEPLPATDAPVCIGTPLLLEVLNTQNGVVYSWLSPNGVAATGPAVSLLPSNLDWVGTYTVSPVLDGCPGQPAALEVNLFVPRQVQLPPDTTLCLRNAFPIATDTTFAAYTWHDGSMGPTFTPGQSGEFFVQTTDFNGCKSADFITVTLIDCDVFIPNVFTPNGDGMNDAFVVQFENARYYKMWIYNRWGRLVWESEDGRPFWDGTHFRNGEACSEGVYFYIAEIISYDGIDYGRSGNITLIRR